MDDKEFLARADKLAARKHWSDTYVSRMLFNGNPRKLARMRKALKNKAEQKRRAAAEKCLQALEAEEGERAVLCR